MERLFNHNIEFSHNILGEMFLNYVNWYKKENVILSECEHIFGTYRRFVLMYHNDKLDENMKRRAKPPFILLDPTPDFAPDPHANFPWRFRGTADRATFNLQNRIFEPIYESEDGKLSVSVVWTRIKGTFDMVVFLRSIYEYLDTRLRTYQSMGGMSRATQPYEMSSHLIISSTVEEFEYKNSLVIDDKFKAELAQKTDEVHLKTTNKYVRGFPIKIRPLFSLESVSDQSSKLANIPEWGLNVSVSYEVEIPSYFVVGTDMRMTNVEVHFDESKTTVANYYGIPEKFLFSIDGEEKEGVLEVHEDIVLDRDYFSVGQYFIVSPPLRSVDGTTQVLCYLDGSQIPLEAGRHFTVEDDKMYMLIPLYKGQILKFAVYRI